MALVVSFAQNGTFLTFSLASKPRRPTYYNYAMRDFVENLSRRAEAIVAFRVETLHEFTGCNSFEQYLERIGLPVKLAAMIEECFDPNHLGDRIKSPMMEYQLERFADASISQTAPKSLVTIKRNPELKRPFNGASALKLGA